MTLIANYQLGEELGKGPLGTVYIATHLVTQKQVVFRGFMKPPGAPEETWAECIQRYNDELSIAIELNHPNIAQIYECGHEEGVYWIASELFTGQNMARILDRHGAMGLEKTSNVVSQVGAALDYALSKGLIHADLTPFNVLLLEDNSVKVINFGLGHIRAKWGSPYLSPELARNEPPDARVDVFSLGVLIYEMLTGDPPWLCSDADSTMAAVLGDDPAPPANESKEVQDVVMRMLAKDPKDRYSTAGEAAVAFCAAIGPTDKATVTEHEKKKGLRAYHAQSGLARFDLTTSDVRSAIDNLRAKLTKKQGG